MKRDAAALTMRERETLRLLMAGHDAKSAASALGLSVHTVNERLRDARRKLGVSSSREAARILGEQERGRPDLLGDAPIGVAEEGAHGGNTASPGRLASWGRHGGALVWLSGGMLIMSLIIAGIVLASIVQPGGAPKAVAEPQAPAVAPAPTETAGVAAARSWIQVVDEGRWQQSWRAAGQLFTAALSEGEWVPRIQSVRQPLGAVSTRVLQSVTATQTLPGVPAGSYEVITFRTSFAGRPAAVETVTVAAEAGGWKVVGYFIR